MSAHAVECARCLDYRFVDVGEHELVPCPECRPTARANEFAASRLARIRTNDTVIPGNRAPVEYRRCLVHGQLVGLDGDGRLLGKCWSCATDAADAIARIERR